MPRATTGAGRTRPAAGAAPKAAAKARAASSPKPRAKDATRTADPRLAPYAGKRDFAATPEPGASPVLGTGNRFVVQKHDARRLHFDLRLELDGVLKSWAVTKGPSLVPGDKRLAVHTEDHPLEYLTFEGVIPKGEYGGGTMIVWDTGTWRPEADPHRGYAKGHLEFTLEGRRLGGRWHLVRMRPRPRETKEQWLLIKGEDDFARAPGDPEIAVEETTSVLSGRSNADLAAEGEVRPDHAAREAAAAKRPRADLSRVKGAKKGLLPLFVEPALATLADVAPAGGDWIHEIKFDGYRVQARVDGGRVALLTRRGLDWTDRFPAVAAAVRDLGLDSALLDGEVVVEDGAGVSDFSALQAAIAEGRSERMVYHLFDLLYLSGYDLTRAPQAERKALLAGLLDDAPRGGAVRFSDHVEGEGEAMVRHACRLGLEGIVAKRRDAPYRSGRSQGWLKIKCVNRQEFVVAGYMPSTTRRKAVGSLVLGVYEDGRLVHVGRVGTGFDERSAGDLFAALEAIRRDAPPFAEKLPAAAARGVKWAEPRLVAEVETRGWTADGLLRHASFKGLCEDKPPEDVMREGAAAPGTAAPTWSARLSHPDRVLWPDVGVTKQGLAEFYADVAHLMLPQVAGRPLALVRCPNGTGEDCFFQKHAFAGIGEAIRRGRVGDEEVLFIDDLDGLIALVQASALEIHPWGCRVDDPERPDRVVLDLDPDEGLDWSRVVDGAAAVRERLDALGLVSFLKTTGGKGLHVVVPLAPRAGWDEVKAFAAGIAAEMARDAPDRFTDTVAKRARTGKIYLDYLRNGRGATAIGAYSTRARPRAPVSTPIGWDELSADLRSDHFTIANLRARLRHLAADPWADIGRIDQALPQAGGRAGRRAASGTPRRGRR